MEKCRYELSEWLIEKKLPYDKVLTRTCDVLDILNSLYSGKLLESPINEAALFRSMQNTFDKMNGLGVIEGHETSCITLFTSPALYAYLSEKKPTFVDFTVTFNRHRCSIDLAKIVTDEESYGYFCKMLKKG